MAVKYSRHYAKRSTALETAQTEPIVGKSMLKNSAGGYSFAVDDWKRLERFLVLGTEGGSYYASEKKMTVDNAKTIEKCIENDGPRVVKVLTEISDKGRAPKNDPALFVLAMCAGLGDDETKRLALAALPKVARIGTHLFTFAEYVEGFRGWGRALAKGVANWYNSMPADKLSYQAIKYQQRNGWSHRDMLRLSHPKPIDGIHKDIYFWITKGWEDVGSEPHPNEVLRKIWAFEHLQKSVTKEAEAIKLITEYNLPRECVPTQFLTSPEIWDALLRGNDMPMTAMIRNLGNMSKCGLLKPLSSASMYVVERLGNQEQLKKARIHPIQVLSALTTYGRGCGVRGSGTWEVDQDIVDALDGAFYKTFENVEPTGKRIVIGLDVSGSMDGGQVSGIVGLSPRIASAAMCMITYAAEKQCTIMGFSHQLVPVPISRKMRLDTVVQKVSEIPMGGTDCALPMLWAAKEKVEADAFIIFTDSETWFGSVHPCQALVKYRHKFGIPAKLIVVGMTATEFTIADPDDAGTLDVVGFNTSAPNVMADFIRE